MTCDSLISSHDQIILVHVITYDSNLVYKNDITCKYQLITSFCDFLWTSISICRQAELMCTRIQVINNFKYM